MENEIESLKKSIWKEISNVLNPRFDIGEFSNEFLHNEDIPRIIYNNKSVIPDSIFKKIIQTPNKDSEIYSIALESLALAAFLRINSNEKYSIIFAKCYCALYFTRSESSSSQFEQIFFSTKFIELFGSSYKWNTDDIRLKEFVQSMFYKISKWSEDIDSHKNDIESFKKTL